MECCLDLVCLLSSSVAQLQLQLQRLRHRRSNTAIALPTAPLVQTCNASRSQKHDCPQLSDNRRCTAAESCNRHDCSTQHCAAP
jgi:hypothetical protein